MTTENPTEQRIVELESRIAFQEDAIQALSDEIYRQQKELERLQHMSNLLIQRMQELAESGGNAIVDEKPPHY